METQQFQSQLRETLAGKLSSVDVFDVIDSSNAEALRRLQDPGTEFEGPALLVARSQTAGRGRRGRQWLSPKDSGLFLSLLYPYRGDLNTVAGLSLVTALVVRDALAEYGANDLQLKWPNDVLHHGSKLAGILLESKRLPNQTAIVFGMGVNLSLSEQEVNSIDRKVISLDDLLADEIDRVLLIALITERLLSAIHAYESQGFAPFQENWNKVDRYIGQDVVIDNGQQRRIGRSAGVNPDGALILHTGSGEEIISGGEIFPSLIAED